MVHGHVADGIQTNSPDVFVSSDGGYNFAKALDGPHHYQMADQGGILVAVPSGTREATIIKFSTDEGRCWHEYTFTKEPLIITGLLTEPGNKAMHVGIWGFHTETRKWVVNILDFSKVITRQCGDDDYETWEAHSEMNHEKEAKYRGCLLGVKESFKRLKKDSWCYNGRAWEPSKTQQICECSKDDYECDYGYWRPVNQLECKRNTNITQQIICEHGKEELLKTQGYRKIPGDKCQGGVTITHDKLEELTKNCVEGEKFTVPPTPAGGMSGAGTAVIVIVVILILIIVLLMGIFFGRKCYLLRKNNITYKYSMLNQSEEFDYDNEFENALSSHPSLYHDSEEEDVHTAQISNGRPVGHRDMGRSNHSSKPILKSYHDDSDDDLLE